jgi:hypothetical protein
MKHAILMLLGALTSCGLPELQTACPDSEGSGELFTEPSCNACASHSCCAEATACTADAGCRELMGCLRECAESGGDEACFGACRNIEHDAAVADALADCVSQRCEAEDCTLPERTATCTDAGTVPDVFGRFTCDMCIRREACNAALICAGAPACAARLDCMSKCVGPDLHPACFDECRGDGQVQPGDSAFFQTVARECRDECSIGTEFACVEDFVWPTTDLQRVDVSFRALDRSTAEPFSGLQVTSCATQPFPCEKVGNPATVTTGADGGVTVNVPTANGFDDASYSGFRGYHLWDEPTGDPDLWLPTILFHNRPEYRNRAADEIAPFGNGALITTVLDLVALQSPAITRDPTRGNLLGGLVDCHGSTEFFAKDVVVEVEGADALTRVRYVAQDQTQLDPAATATTEAGQFIVINVQPGTPVVRLVHEPTDKVLTQSPVQIRPNIVTVFGAWPQAK